MAALPPVAAAASRCSARLLYALPAPDKLPSSDYPPQVHPPTAVTHCIAAWLTRPAAALVDGDDAGPGAALPDLVVVRSTQLELYAMRCAADAGLAAALGVGGASRPAARAAAAAAASQGAPPPPPPALELLHSCSLFGVVESVAVLRARAPGQRDALMLTFRQGWLEWCSGGHG